jgi:hypothetical protein
MHSSPSERSSGGNGSAKYDPGCENLKKKDRGNYKDEDDHDVLPHVDEIRKEFFIRFFELAHGDELSVTKLSN